MFRSILIDDFMTKNLATATRDMDLLALVDLLLRRGISGTPVVDQSGHLIGMVSEHDCLKAILVGTYSFHHPIENAPSHCQNHKTKKNERPEQCLQTDRKQ